jgi:hypothetical protein
MNGPREEHEPEPDPEEPTQRWQVAVCITCGRTIWRRARRSPGGWRHLRGGWFGAEQ